MLKIFFLLIPAVSAIDQDYLPKGNIPKSAAISISTPRHLTTNKITYLPLPEENEPSPPQKLAPLSQVNQQTKTQLQMPLPRAVIPFFKVNPDNGYDGATPPERPALNIDFYFISKEYP